jgi:hypothetical protein
MAKKVSFLEYFVAFVVCTLLVCVAYGILFTLKENVEHAKLQREKDAQEIYDSGYKANKLGVPANANPYVRCSSHSPRYWLDGWMKASEESKGE